jgi:Lamin Tail Domain
LITSTNKLLVLALSMALFLGAAFAAEDENNTKSKIAITNACFKAASPEKDNLNGEWVEIANQGTLAQSLQGWTLSDQDNHTYAFKSFTLQPGASAKVHTGMGDDSATDLFWNMKVSIWNNDGDMATLKDASGNVVSRYPEEPAKP